MYNDRTQMNGAMFRRTMSPQRSSSRDLPLSDRQENSMSRRRCDGTLRNSENGEMPQMPTAPSKCAVGKCGGWGLEEHPLAMVYSPCQAWRDAYAPDVALSRGTLFSELDLPFEGEKNKRGCM